MELVVDAGVFFSILAGRLEGRGADLLFSGEFTFVAPEFMLSEIDKHKSRILELSGLNEKKFNRSLELMSEKVEFIPKAEFEDKIKDAEKLSPDPDDVQYFALASKRNSAIWSDDPDFKKQSEVKVFSTRELSRLFFTTF